MEAYLDIETTGLACFGDAITVIGIFRCDEKYEEFAQLWGDQVTAENLLRELEEVETIYTYNGSRFDLPFIEAALRVKLDRKFKHHDLMYDCWGQGLKGGFKAVECRLGIERETRGVTGYDAVLLWYRFKRNGDHNALRTLLQYNKDDVVNLRALRHELARRGSRC